MKKKLLSLCLALVLVLGCLPISVSAAGDTVLTMDTPITVNYPSTGDRATIIVGTFIAPEDNIYSLSGQENATNFMTLY